MKKGFRTFAKIALASSLVLTSLSTPLAGIEIAVAAGTKLPASSTTTLSTIATDLGIPKVMKEVNGNVSLLKYQTKIFPKVKPNSKTIWLDQLPFDLKDPKTGQIYPGYCAQSYAYASSSMTATGLVTDSRIVRLINQISPSNPEKPSDSQQIAIQLVLWGALNTNWSKTMFSGGYMSTKTSSYGGRDTVAKYVQEVAKNWDTIRSQVDKNVKPIETTFKTNTTLKAKCAKVKKKTEQPKTAVATIPWQFIGKGKIKDMNQVADITYSGLKGAKVLRGYNSSDVKRLKDVYGIVAKKNADYIEVDASSGKPGKLTITPKVEYKKHYAPQNKTTLVLYKGGASNQPFIMPVKSVRKMDPIKIEWECKVKPPPPPPPPGSEPVDPTDAIELKEMRWFNMPSAFGEIKNGTGYNQSGVTMTGRFASSRSQEAFDAMLGIPSTERFYINLGGTVGVMDVTYKLYELKQELQVEWEVPWKDDKGEGTEKFNHVVPWHMKALHLESASFRAVGDGAVEQPDLELDIKVINANKNPGSFTLAPNKAGLKVGPAVGDTKYNFGATKKWQVNTKGVKLPKKTKKPTKKDTQEEAFKKANGIIGDIFAQNDKLEITLDGKTYSYVPSINKKTSVPFKEKGPFELDATDKKDEKYFNPVGQTWDIWSKVPIKGYTGNPEDDASRNLGGTPLKLEHLPINEKVGNGIYQFEESEEGNKLDYEAMVTTVKGDEEPLHDDVADLKDGTNEGTSTVYKSSEDPVDNGAYQSDNTIMLQYTNWQVPVSTGEGITFKHSQNAPDGNLNSSLGDNPSYRSLNPILIHNPTTTMYSWISDIPDTQLQDQRIVGSSSKIQKHSRASNGPSRQYVDYDFQVTIPNTAAYDKYWSQASKNTTQTGVMDTDHTAPGTLGKGYKGSAASKQTSRQYNNPYGTGGGWDVSKWTNAKYVMFPYKVYYYKNRGESGGDTSGFYEAGQWIKLYDDDQTVKVGDPTEFNFHVSGESKDVKNGIVYIMSEANNMDEGLIGDPDSVYESSEQYVNGTRLEEGSDLGPLTTDRNGQASTSTANQINVDLIGRIGNTLVSDTSDPAWKNVFWKTSKGKIDTKSPVQKDYGTNFNMYDSIVAPNQTGFSAYDRYRKLTSWHGGLAPKQTLPVTTNVTTKGKESQTIKMGYNIDGSVQTTGDYDYSMWIYPQNKLAGKYVTGKPSDHFKLITSDPYMPGTKFSEYYDSDVNNSLHGKKGVLGKEYKPNYKHQLSKSLADPRSKMSAWEKQSSSYQKAVQLGSNKKTITGTPSWIQVPRSLRTLVGTDTSEGRWGVGYQNGNNFLGSKLSTSSSDCTCAYENTQKWNWNYNLPQNTKIWFDRKSSNTSKNGIPKFESPSRDQYIITSFTFRTKSDRDSYPGEGDFKQDELHPVAIQYGDNYLFNSGQSMPDWDLTMYTNTGVSSNPDKVATTKNTPKGITPSFNPETPMTWDPTQGGPLSSPSLDIVWWNYSKNATTDKDSIGTH